MHNDGVKKKATKKRKPRHVVSATSFALCAEHVNPGDFVEWPSPPMLGATSGFQYRAKTCTARVTAFVSGVALVRFDGPGDRGPWPVIPGQPCKVVYR